MEPNTSNEYNLDFNINYLYLIGGFIIIIIFLCYFINNKSIDNKNNSYIDKISIKQSF